MSDLLATDSADVVGYVVRDYVARVELRRPGALNAVNADLAEQLGQALERAQVAPEVRAVVLHGAGRAFCAGADLKALSRGESLEPRTDPRWGFAGITRHWIDKPLVAAVHGLALGGGLEIMLACDLAVVEEDVRLGLPEVTRGLMAGGGGAVRLPRTVPLRRALEIGLTGRTMTAAEALEWGLVNEVVSVGAAVDRALELAALIAANAPLAVRATKRVMHLSAADGPDWHPEGSTTAPWSLNDEEQGVVMVSDDAAEGPAAFAQRRPPRWRGQ